MNAMREMDELGRIREQIPESTTRFVLASPLSPALRELTQEQLDALQLVHNNSKIQDALDKSILSDLETYQALLYLIRNGYIREGR